MSVAGSRPPSAEVGRRPKHSFKPVVTSFGRELLLAKGDYTASNLLSAALLQGECATFPQLVDSLFKASSWSSYDLRDLISGMSKHLTMVHAGQKIDPAGIVAVLQTVGLSLPVGYDKKLEKRQITTAEYVQGCAVYLNGLYRRGRLEKADLWLDIQANVPTADLANLLILVVGPAVLELPKGKIDKLTLQQVCRNYGLELTGNCAVSLYDLMAEELAYIRLIDGKSPLQVAEVNLNRASTRFKAANAGLGRARTETAAASVAEAREVVNQAFEALTALRAEAQRAVEAAQQEDEKSILEVVPVPTTSVSATTISEEETMSDTKAESMPVVRGSSYMTELYRGVRLLLTELEVKKGWPKGRLDVALATKVARAMYPEVKQVAPTVSAMEGKYWKRVKFGAYELLNVQAEEGAGLSRVKVTPMSDAQVAELVANWDVSLETVVKPVSLPGQQAKPVAQVLATAVTTSVEGESEDQQFKRVLAARMTQLRVEVDDVSGRRTVAEKKLTAKRQEILLLEYEMQEYGEKLAAWAEQLGHMEALVK